MCEWKPDFDRLDERVDSIEARLTAVESATRDGLAAVNGNIETLSQQIANMDKRIIEEKQKWGSILRKIVLASSYTLLSLAALAAGLNIVRELAPHIFN